MSRHAAPRSGRRDRGPKARGRAGVSVMRRVISGDRPYVLAFFVLLAVLAMMVVGPLQTYTAAAARVRDLQASQAALQQRVADLQIREGRLRDPEELELAARERLGLVKPGEIPYIVSDGEADSDQVRPDGRLPTPPASPSVLERLVTAFASLFQR